MRLHLDSLAPKSADVGQSASVSAQDSAGGGLRGRDAASSRDSIAISGPSSALNRLAGERAVRIQQLSAAVQSGNYRVSSSAISGAIVAQAAL